VLLDGGKGGEKILAREPYPRSGVVTCRMDERDLEDRGKVGGADGHSVRS